VSRAVLLAAAVALLPACFRLSDPVYAFRSLRAPEPSAAGNSLLFGSLEITALVGHIDTVKFRRVSPRAPGEHYPTATERNIYRVFRPRTMKDGHFLVEVPPGVYEIDGMVGGIWGQDAVFLATGDARVGTRIVVAQPGVYDLGVVRVEAGAFSTQGTLVLVGRGGSERQALLREAVAGTEWERFLPGGR
jgi:hypothetical protein